MIHKFENPSRIAELNPVETLTKLGLSEQSTFCDIGAGTGIFTYAAAQITQNRIYAVEISDTMREILHSRKNTFPVTIEDSVQKVPSHSCDQVLLCTVLHELSDIPEMLREIRRILKPHGTLIIIEFHKEVTPMGPPVDHRISQQEASDVITENGFVKIRSFTLGDNFYTLTFEPGKEV